MRDEIVDSYLIETNEEKRLCSHKVLNFNTEKNANVVEKLFKTVDMYATLCNRGAIRDYDTMYSCFVAGLPPNEYALEI